MSGVKTCLYDIVQNLKGILYANDMSGVKACLYYSCKHKGEVISCEQSLKSGGWKICSAILELEGSVLLKKPVLAENHFLARRTDTGSLAVS